MNEDTVRRIVKEEISGLFRLDGYRFEKHLQLLDGRNVQTGRTTGTKIATASDQLLGFYGATPVDRPATISDPSGGATIDSQARTAINTIIDRLQELGLIA
jgi:hypothetical protein